MCVEETSRHALQDVVATSSASYAARSLNSEVMASHRCDYIAGKVERWCRRTFQLKDLPEQKEELINQAKQFADAVQIWP